MILTRKFLLVMLLCWPFMSVAADAPNANTLANNISSAASIDAASTVLQNSFKQLSEYYKDKVEASEIEEAQKEIDELIASAKTCDEDEQQTDDENKDNENKDNNKNNEEVNKDNRTAEQKQKDLEAAKNKYEEAKANEQSMANKTLTAATTAATGLGAMELARGLSEQQADKEAEQSMANYIATMRCSYAEGKSVKAGPDEIELPGGNNEELMKYRSEYFALANDLKERKTALGMKPGIESEEILDKATSGLYDDESIGIESGTYASLYRAQMLGSEADQAKIDEEKSASKKRVIGGAVAAGVGIVGGVVGNSLINGKLGEKIKELKNKKASTKENNEIIQSWKQCLNRTGMKNVNRLDLSGFDMTGTKETLDTINCEEYNLSSKDATKDIDVSNGESGLGNSLGLLFVEANKKTSSTSVSTTGTITIKEDAKNEVTAPQELASTEEYKYFDEVPKGKPSAAWIQENCQWQSTTSFDVMPGQYDTKLCNKYHEPRCEHYVMGDGARGGCNSSALTSDQSDTCNYCLKREKKESICLEEVKRYCFDNGYLYPEPYGTARAEMNRDWFSYACLKASGTPDVSNGKCLCNNETGYVTQTNGPVITFEKCTPKK